jgi:hypothetical protein
MQEYYVDNKEELINLNSLRVKREKTEQICVICNNSFFARKSTKCCGDNCRSQLNNINACKRSKNLSKQAKEVRNLAKSTKYGENWDSFSGKRSIRAAKRKAKLKTDINFKLADTLRSRLKHALKGNQKSGSAVKDLGCSIEELKKHLESQWQPDMSWNNWTKNGWHIDHIKPLSRFNLSNRDEFLKACHYSNLQPLWASDNWSKSNNMSSPVEEVVGNVLKMNNQDMEHIDESKRITSRS